ncbi:MAG: DegV family protein [Anaerolineae bacterium]|nr:DegV family protein [Anaerolineae bacterium]
MITIIADTTSCLSLDTVNQLGIPYLPQFIVFGDQMYRDDTELNSDAFIQRLKSSPTLPKTSAPQPSLYTPIYRECVERGDTVIVICPSVELSGTFRGASVAAQDFAGADIRIIDSRSIGSGLGELVLYARKLVQEGRSADFIVNAVKEMASREKLLFLVDTLEYLYKGGRIGGARALVGSVLQVKPILELRNGRAEAAESLRTKSRALTRFKQMIYEGCPHGDHSHLTIMHGGNIEEAALLANEFSTQLEISNIPLYYLPPAIMVHAGPKVIAVSYYKS